MTTAPWRRYAAGGRPTVVTKRIVHDMDKSFFPTQTIVPSTEIVGSGDAGAVPGLHPGLPVLSGGVCVPPGPQPQRGPVRPVRRGELRRLRVSGGDAVQPLHQRLRRPDPAVRPAGGLLSAAPCESVPAQSAGGQLLHEPDGAAGQGPQERPDLRPEAGTQRLRDVINKNVTQEDLLQSCRTAFAGATTP